MGVNVVIILTLLPALALLPKARAGCSNSARPDPCGGPPARAVPTATSSGSDSEPNSTRNTEPGTRKVRNGTTDQCHRFVLSVVDAGRGDRHCGGGARYVSV